MLFTHLLLVGIAYTRTEYVLPGNHGFDNMNREMLALFVAQGVNDTFVP